MPTILPDAELSTWEPEFGQDVRYWELRYLCAASGAPDKQLAPGFNAASEFLVEALRRRLATSNTLVLLEAAGNPASLVAACTLLPAVELQDGADIPEAIALQQEDKARFRILDTAVATDPAWAWAYYARAMLWFDLGQQQLGLQDMRRGNAAPRGEYPRPWPMAAIQATPCVDNPPGGIAVTAAIADTLEPSYDCMFFAGRCNNHLKESLLCANLSGDLSALEDWHQFACNLVTKSGNNFTSRTLASILLANLRNYAEECYGDAASAVQVETLQRMRGAQLAVRSIDSRPWRYTGVTYILELLDPARGWFCAKYLAYRGDLRVHSGTPAVYTDLSQVHYPQLNLPECLLKYEAVSEEEAQRRNEQRRAQLEAEQASADDPR